MRRPSILLLALALCPTAVSQVQPPAAGSNDARVGIYEQMRLLGVTDAQHDRAVEAGRMMFGSDKRWAMRKEDPAAGTLFDKRPSDFKEGDWGSTRYMMRVRKVVSKTECVVLPRQAGTAPFYLLRGFDTKNVTVGSEFVLQHPVVIAGKYRYKPSRTSNETETILVMEGDAKKLGKLIAKAGGAAEAGEPDEDAKLAKLIEAAKHEIDRLKAAVKEDEDRLRSETQAAERQNVEARLKVHKAQLAEQEQRLASLGQQAEARKKAADAAKVKAEEDRKRQAAAAAAREFVGRWRITDDKGTTACFFTLTDNFEAKKSHAPDATAKWEVVGNEARITWSDGWRDILRPEKGRVVKIALRPGTTWTDKPTNTQYASKDP